MGTQKNLLDETYVVGAQKNLLHEMVLLKTQNQFKLMDKKIFTIYAEVFFWDVYLPYDNLL